MKTEQQITQPNPSKQTKTIVLKALKDNATMVALVALAITFGILNSSSFFTPRNLTNLANQTTITGIIAVGMTGAILLGGIDLSVGSVVGLASVVVTLMMKSGVNVWLACFLTVVLCGFVLGAWNGFWIAHYKIAPFIITLGLMTIARGLALALAKGSSVPVVDPTQMFAQIGGSFIPKSVSGIIILAALAWFIFSIYREMQQKRQYGIETKQHEMIVNVVIVVVGLGLAFYVFTSYRGIPMPVAFFVIIAAVGSFILQSSKLGRRLYALGGNEEAARLSGINIFQTKMFVFTVASSLSAFAGILLTSRLNGGSPNLGTGFELDAIAAVVIGGTSLSGGSGTITGTVIGALIIGVLNNGMSLLGVQDFYQLMIKGFLIMFAVWFDTVSKKKKA